MQVRVIDSCGELCPVPLIRLRLGVRQLTPGDMLVLRTDQSCAVPLIVAEGQRLGLKAEVDEIEPALWELRLHR